MSYNLHHMSILSLGKDILTIVGGGWVDPRACLDGSKKTFFSSARKQTRVCWTHSLVTVLTELLQSVVTCFKILNP